MSFSVKVDKQSIPQLIHDIEDISNYMLPSFQRRFLWDEDDILKLLDSIKNGYPIGNVILWKKPENVEIEEIDPLSKPLIRTIKKDASSTYFVIDGQQRLTSLLLAFNGWRITRGDEEISRSPISYEPNSGRFYKGAKRGKDFSIILRGLVYGDYKALREVFNEFSREAYAKVEEVTTAFKSYEIPTYVIETPGINENVINMLVEAFIRVNKYGERIKSLELVLSYIAGRVSGKAKENIMRLFNCYEKSFDLDLQPLIRYSLAVSNVRQSGISSASPRKMGKLVKDYKGQITETLVERYDEVKRGLDFTYRFMKNTLGITSAEILPSQITLVPLSVFFYGQRIKSIDQLSESEKRKIEDWFVLVNFTTYYTSKTDSKLQKDINVLKEASRFPYSDLIKNISEYHGRTLIKENDVRRGMKITATKRPGKPYLFLLYMLLVKNDADDWTGIRIRARKWGDLSTHHLFPRDYILDNKDKLEYEDQDELEKLISNICNISKIEKSKNIEIGSTPPKKYLKELDITTLDKHMIPRDDSLYDIEHYDEFLEKRMKLILNNLTRHYSSIVSS
ncbi:hypothetical protein DRN63_00375 [Nanoarchaeota archaeon]|nr:MAG: hypothetical protein DRN63_00375 [Nanoarchaeota archaeon]